jgi:cyclase
MIRVIPILLLKDEALVKGVKFKSHNYIGDPINAVKIFNEKEVDEIVLLDISSYKNGINFQLIEEIASELFVPLSYGGGINSTSQISKLFNLGVEKVILGTAAHTHPELISQAASMFGSQSIVVSIDVKKNIFGKYSVYVENGKKNINIDPIDYAKKMEHLGAGELNLNSIDREGTGQGFDSILIQKISNLISIPLVVSGGARHIQDFYQIVESANLTAVAAGNLFVYYGKYKAVLITYPKIELDEIFKEYDER